MEQEMTKCPYCGEEILAVAKKCKHCGEWLYEEEVEEDVVDGEDDADSENVVYVKEDDEPNFWYYLVGIIIIVAIAFFTLPSEEKQTERMKEELRVLVRKDIRNKTQNKDVLTQTVGKGMMKDKDIVDGLVLQRYSINVNNYKVFSSITVTEKETGDSRTCGFAAFGIIYIKK